MKANDEWTGSSSSSSSSLPSSSPVLNACIYICISFSEI